MEVFNLNKLKELRGKKGLTLKEMSALLNEKYGLNISDGQLSNYENGKRAPRDNKTWEILADFFGVNIGYVMGLTTYNNNEYPEDAYEYLEKKTDYDSYEKMIDDSAKRFSKDLFSPIATKSANNQLAYSLLSFSTTYNFILKAHGPKVAEELSKSIKLICELAQIKSNTMILKDKPAEKDLTQNILKTKDELSNLISDLIIKDLTFYETDDLNSHKPFYENN